MANDNDANDELLLEARRTTHAVRAIATFLLLFVTFQLLAAVVVAFGVWEISDGGEGWILIALAGLTSFAGLALALWVAWDELRLSESTTLVRPVAREKAPAMAQDKPNPTDQERDGSGRLADHCTCNKWIRGFGGTSMIDNVETCLRCRRIIATT